MKHFNKAANGTAANQHQADITLRESYIRNINVKINDNHKMNTYLIPGSMIRKYSDIVKTYPDYGKCNKSENHKCHGYRKNIITKSVVGYIDTCVCLHRPIIVN